MLAVSLIRGKSSCPDSRYCGDSGMFLMMLLSCVIGHVFLFSFCPYRSNGSLLVNRYKWNV